MAGFGKDLELIDTITSTVTLQATACSSDGSTVYVLDSDNTGALYSSTTYGENLTEVSSWTSADYMTCDPAGTTVFVMVGGVLWRSTDSGVNFTQVNSTNQLGVTCGTNGSTVYAVSASTNLVQRSTDSGNSFNTSSGYVGSAPTDVACSDDGVTVYCSNQVSGSVYRSVDSGATFNLITNGFLGSVSGLACSADGKIVYLIINAVDSIYSSTDFGENFNFVGTTSSTNPYAVACSSDGSTVYLPDSSNGELWRSRSGATLGLQLVHNGTVKAGGRAEIPRIFIADSTKPEGYKTVTKQYVMRNGIPVLMWELNPRLPAWISNTAPSAPTAGEVWFKAGTTNDQTVLQRVNYQLQDPLDSESVDGQLTFKGENFTTAIDKPLLYSGTAAPTDADGNPDGTIYVQI